jgi:hypothetical protein
MNAAGNWIMCLSGSNEVAWNQARALMNQLIESMLSVCSRLTLSVNKIFMCLIQGIKVIVNVRMRMSHEQLTSQLNFTFTLSTHPDNWTSFEVYILTVFSDPLSIRLHVTLLEVCGKAMQILIVRQEGCRLSAVEIRVPNAQQCENDRCLKFKNKM